MEGSSQGSLGSVQAYNEADGGLASCDVTVLIGFNSCQPYDVARYPVYFNMTLWSDGDLYRIRILADITFKSQDCMVLQ